MSLNFALKDLYYNGPQSKAYFRGNIAVFMLVTVFLNLYKCAGILFLPSPITQYTLTINEIFSQFNLFTIGTIFLLAAVVAISNNHAVVQTRKHDIAVMKAVGTYPQQLYTFYVYEILILVLLTYIIGWMLGYGMFFILFLILRNWFALTWIPDFFLSASFMVILVMLSFLINGWEIRRIGNKSYGETKTGKIGEYASSKMSPRMKKFLFRKTIGLKMAVKNLLRKKYEVRQNLILLSLASMILFTGVCGSIIVGGSEKDYIQKAQGEYIVAIGGDSVITAFNQGYEQFASPVTPNLTIGEYLALSNNLTGIQPELEALLTQYGITFWEPRLFTVDLITERSGLVLETFYNSTSGQISTNYTEIGGNRDTRLVPIQGVNFGATVQQWTYEGALVNFVSGAAVGDTLAGELYENAYLQFISYFGAEKNTTFRNKINAVVIDPMNNGNSVYIPLPDLQADFNRTNYYNLALIDYSAIVLGPNDGQLANFLEDLEALVGNSLGNSFAVMDMRATFAENIAGIQDLQVFLILTGAVMAGVIILAMHYFVQGRVKEDQKDYFIMHAMGGTKAEISQTIFFEIGALICVGTLIGLILALYFILFFLLQDATLPHVAVPFGIYAGILTFFLGVAYLGGKAIDLKKITNTQNLMA